MFRRTLRCSFCGRDETQVSKLVAGLKVYICDACVATARQIMEDTHTCDDSRLRTPLSLWRRIRSRIFQDGTRDNLQRRIHAGAS